MHRSPRPRNVEIRADDPALTSHGGLLLTGELAVRTDLVVRLDRAIDAVRPFKVRRRGRSGGELLVALAELMVVGGDHLLHLDELREDEAGAELRAVDEVPAPTTAGQLMRRLKRPPMPGGGDGAGQGRRGGRSAVGPERERSGDAGPGLL